MKCSTCGFELYYPLGSTATAWISLYDDGRFPGRLIVALKDHYDHMEEVPENLFARYMKDITVLSRELKEILGSPRINMAILGNTVEHVHAHLIPRYPLAEEKPNKSPWDDPRSHSELADRNAIMRLLKENLSLING